MMIRKYCVLLAATSLAGTTPAYAQQTDAIAAELAAMRARIDALQARVAELEAERAAAAAVPLAQPAPPSTTQPQSATPAAAPQPEIQFRGAPQITAPGGWSFKPRGRLQFDVGYVSSPPGITDPGLGLASEVRRARLGVEGTIPGGFGYVFELDFATETVEITDAILTYRASEEVGLTVGQHNAFQSLEELTSSRFSSFIERAAFTDAFNFERRLGVSASWTHGDLIAQAGVFADNLADLNDDADDSRSVDGRLVYTPKFGDTQLHLGGSAHWRDNGDLARMMTTRYRQRPLVHTTDVRFISTPALNVESETNYGLEAALIHGPFHAAGEVNWLTADTLTVGISPTFFGGYAEVGYYLTGESRGYRGGRWDRTRVRNPVGGENGGIGAFQVNLRYDYLDLNSDGITGGIQNGLEASLIWIPTDYVRFMLNYGHLIYDDAAIPAAGGDRDYSVDVLGARAQIDF
ncbi:MAG: OprO/OprP family phosphate-selective porin [Allosphingosinicella sp.]